MTDLTNKAVLYFDWDGVVNFFGSRSQYRKHSGLGYMRRGSASPLEEPRGGWASPQTVGPFPLNWSAELLRKLEELPVELVFLSTWRHSFVNLSRATQWNPTVRVLDWTDGPRGAVHAGKVEALVADQLANPRPFIWADDEAIQFYTEDKRELLGATPQLLLEPKEEIGLTIEDYEKMVAFLASLEG